jgi:hypothetical protein
MRSVSRRPASQGDAVSRAGASSARRRTPKSEPSRTPVALRIETLAGGSPRRRSHRPGEAARRRSPAGGEIPDPRSARAQPAPSWELYRVSAAADRAAAACGVWRRAPAPRSDRRAFRRWRGRRKRPTVRVPDPRDRSRCRSRRDRTGDSNRRTESRPAAEAKRRSWPCRCSGPRRTPSPPDVARRHRGRPARRLRGSRPRSRPDRGSGSARRRAAADCRQAPRRARRRAADAQRCGEVHSRRVEA